jgi:hypothetical protein
MKENDGKLSVLGGKATTDNRKYNSNGKKTDRTIYQSRKLIGFLNHQDGDPTLLTEF